MSKLIDMEFVESGGNYIVPEIYSIDLSSYERYISDSSGLWEAAPDISKLTKHVINKGNGSCVGRLFENLIDLINENLSNPKIGMAVVDIPESERHNSTENAFWGVALSLALGSNIFSLGRDRVNDTPYTVYAASYRNSKGLVDLGLSPVAPETKLGFHSDGLLLGENVSMPINIMLYNISIAYLKPGNFYWIPFALWDERDWYIQRVGIDRPSNINVTPSIYEMTKGRLEVVSPRQVTVPVFVSTKNFGTALYLNGDVLSAVGDPCLDAKALISDLRRSLAINRTRFCVPQKERRIIFARNALGAHARDVFEGPNMNARYTRMFLRSVDENCIELMGGDQPQSTYYAK